MKRSTGENLGRMTVSVGVASFPSDERVRSLNRASRLVPLRAKHNGRNRVICEVDPEFLVLADRQVA